MFESQQLMLCRQQRSTVKLLTDSNWEENDKSSSIPLIALYQDIRWVVQKSECFSLHKYSV